MIHIENKLFFNNCWGRVYLKEESISSCEISYDSTDSLLAWKWSWPKEKPQDLKGYPSIIIGDKAYSPPGDDSTTDPNFPLFLPKTRSIIASGDIEVIGSGGYDFAYDMFFLEGSSSTPSAVRSEIMIWFISSFTNPASKKGEYQIDGYTYDYHVNTEWDPQKPYLAFVLHGDKIPKQIPIHEFIKIGIEDGYVDPNSYLGAIELGPEIWWGEGNATVRNYTVTLLIE